MALMDVVLGKSSSPGKSAEEPAGIQSKQPPHSPWSSFPLFPVFSRSLSLLLGPVDYAQGMS